MRLTIHRVMLVVCAAPLLFANPAFADTVIGDLNANDARSLNHTFQAQTFMVPAGESSLISYSLRAGSTNEGNTATLSLFPYNGIAQSYSGPALDSGTFAINSNDEVLTRSLNLAVTPGQYYAIQVQWSDNGKDSGTYYAGNYYSGGDAQFFDTTYDRYYGTTYDLAFQAVFKGAAPVPTPQALTGGRALFGVMLAPLGMKRVRG